MSRIRKGDMVAVRSGADRGKRGRVLRVIPSADKAVVEGVNLQYKHLRKSQKHPQGGRVRREGPVPMCRLMPVDPTTDRATRVAWRLEGGRKLRVARKTGASLDGEPKAKGKKPAKAEAQ